MASDPDTKRDAELRIRIPTHDRAFTDLCVWFSSGPGWIAARIGSDGPGDSIRIWPLRRAFHLTCPPGRRHRPGPPCWPDQKPVRRWWRDPSQMCRVVTAPRPVPAQAPALEGDTRPYDHAGRGSRRRRRDRHPCSSWLRRRSAPTVRLPRWRSCRWSRCSAAVTAHCMTRWPAGPSMKSGCGTCWPPSCPPGLR
jgi:hypothetical protein